jgi:hypothetical protein
MKKANYFVVIAAVAILFFNLYSCNETSVQTSTSNSVEKISVAIKNDTLIVGLDVENTKSSTTRNSRTFFSKDTVNVNIASTDHSSGTGTFYLIDSLSVADTVYRIRFDSLTSAINVPVIIDHLSYTSFGLVLSNYTGKTAILVTGK